MHKVINLNTTNFEQALSDHDTVVVDFWAPWCGPCQSFAPVFESAAEEHPGILFAKVNVDEAPELAVTHSVRAIPTLKVFRAGAVAESLTGAVPASRLDELLEHTSGR